MHIFEGLAGAAAAIAGARLSRKEEAVRISTRFEQLVIDKNPDKGTTPTPSDILTRVHGIKEKYKVDPLLKVRNLKWAAADVILATSDMTRLMTQNSSPHWAAFAMPLFVTQATDILMRYRQLSKIDNLEWVISDRGDAIRNFQKEESGKLAMSNGIAMNPLTPTR